MADTPAHEQVESLRVEVEYPEHVQRTESALFRENKKLLSGKPCWKCGTHDKIEFHHHAVEWAEWSNADPAKVLILTAAFDPYGFTKADPATPITSPDDKRNLVALCQTCHRGAGEGIHLVPVPFWFADMVKKDGTTVLKAPK